MSEMALVGFREFKEKISDFKEPVRVVKTRNGVTVLGIWVPEGAHYEVLSHGDIARRAGQEARKRDVSSSTTED